MSSVYPAPPIPSSSSPSEMDPFSAVSPPTTPTFTSTPTTGGRARSQSTSSNKSHKHRTGTGVGTGGEGGFEAHQNPNPNRSHSGHDGGRGGSGNHRPTLSNATTISATSNSSSAILGGLNNDDYINFTNYQNHHQQHPQDQEPTASSSHPLEMPSNKSWHRPTSHIVSALTTEMQGSGDWSHLPPSPIPPGQGPGQGHGQNRRGGHGVGGVKAPGSIASTDLDWDSTSARNGFGHRQGNGYGSQSTISAWPQSPSQASWDGNDEDDGLETPGRIYHSPAGSIDSTTTAKYDPFAFPQQQHQQQSPEDYSHHQREDSNDTVQYQQYSTPQNRNPQQQHYDPRRDPYAPQIVTTSTLTGKPYPSHWPSPIQEERASQLGSSLGRTPSLSTSYSGHTGIAGSVGSPGSGSQPPSGSISARSIAATPGGSSYFGSPGTGTGGKLRELPSRKDSDSSEGGMIVDPLRASINIDASPSHFHQRQQQPVSSQRPVEPKSPAESSFSRMDSARPSIDSSILRPSMDSQRPLGFPVPPLPSTSPARYHEPIDPSRLSTTSTATYRYTNPGDGRLSGRVSTAGHGGIGSNEESMQPHLVRASLFSSEDGYDTEYDGDRNSRATLGTMRTRESHLDGDSDRDASFTYSYYMDPSRTNSSIGLELPDGPNVRDRQSLVPPGGGTGTARTPSSLTTKSSSSSENQPLSQASEGPFAFDETLAAGSSINSGKGLSPLSSSSNSNSSGGNTTGPPTPEGSKVPGSRDQQPKSSSGDGGLSFPAVPPRSPQVGHSFSGSASSMATITMGGGGHASGSSGNETTFGSGSLSNTSLPSNFGGQHEEILAGVGNHGDGDDTNTSGWTLPELGHYKDLSLGMSSVGGYSSESGHEHAAVVQAINVPEIALTKATPGGQSIHLPQSGDSRAMESQPPSAFAQQIPPYKTPTHHPYAFSVSSTATGGSVPPSPGTAGTDGSFPRSDHPYAQKPPNAARSPLGGSHNPQSTDHGRQGSLPYSDHHARYVAAPTGGDSGPRVPPKFSDPLTSSEAGGTFRSRGPPVSHTAMLDHSLAPGRMNDDVPTRQTTPGSTYTIGQQTHDSGSVPNSATPLNPSGVGKHHSPGYSSTEGIFAKQQGNATGKGPESFQSQQILPLNLGLKHRREESNRSNASKKTQNTLVPGDPSHPYSAASGATGVDAGGGRPGDRGFDQSSHGRNPSGSSHGVFFSEPSRSNGVTNHAPYGHNRDGSLGNIGGGGGTSTAGMGTDSVGSLISGESRLRLRRSESISRYGAGAGGGYEGPGMLPVANNNSGGSSVGNNHGLNTQPRRSLFAFLNAPTPVQKVSSAKLKERSVWDADSPNRKKPIMITVAVVLTLAIIGIIVGVVIGRRNSSKNDKTNPLFQAAGTGTGVNGLIAGGSYSGPTGAVGAGGKSGYGKLVVFGASWCDSGHERSTSYASSLTGAPYWQGRWSNGPVWDEYLQDMISPDQKGNVTLKNYAYGGAQINNSLNAANVPDIPSQINSFITNLDKGDTSDRTLVALWVGLNTVSADWGSILTAANSSDYPPTALMKNATASLTQAATTIYNSLSRIASSNLFPPNQPPDFLILPLPPGEMQVKHVFMANNQVTNPHFTSAQGLQMVKDLTNDFNQALLDQGKAFATNATTQGRVVTWDVPGAWYGARQDPEKDGVKIIDAACYNDIGDKSVCKNPQDYLYWDSFHPPTTIHKQIAKSIQDVLSTL